MAVEDISTAREIEAAFYAAFQELDGQAMDRVWAKSPEVFCIHPGGPLLSGREEVVASWVEIFSSADPPTLEYRLLRSHENGDVAVHLVEERISPGRAKSSEAAIVFSTNVYQRTSAGWRLLSHHASVPLVRRGDADEERERHLH